MMKCVCTCMLLYVWVCVSVFFSFVIWILHLPFCIVVFMRLCGWEQDMKVISVLQLVIIAFWEKVVKVNYQPQMVAQWILVHCFNLENSMSVTTHTYSSWQLTWYWVQRQTGRVSITAQKFYFLSILKTLSHNSFKTLQLFLNKRVECSLKNSLHSFIDCPSNLKMGPSITLQDSVLPTG